MNRKQWEAMRVDRINRQGDIQISIDKAVPVRCDGKTAEVSFAQEFGSSVYKDKVQKTLSLEYIQDAWKITRETVTKGRSY